MSNNVVSIETADEVGTLLNKEEVINSLIAIGVNQIYRSYDDSQKELYNQFLNAKLSFIAPCWSALNDQVKIDVLSAHEEEFINFVTRGA